jgi:hypothetical protein
MAEVVGFAVGDSVRTTKPNLSMRDDWTEVAWSRKRWGVEGKITSKHNSHGVCFEVEHEDGTKAVYDASELELF